MASVWCSFCGFLFLVILTKGDLYINPNPYCTSNSDHEALFPLCTNGSRYSYLDNTVNCTNDLNAPDPMKNMLNAMEAMFESGNTYDDDYYNSLHECMGSIDPDLPAAQVAAWKGIIEYWSTGGAENDIWGERGPSWYEGNELCPEGTETDVCGMMIYEPCDYTSNIAYYHIVTEICNRNKDENNKFHISHEYIKALVQAFSMVGMGSSFMHGTNTYLGGSQDTTSNDLFAYIQHQASVSSLPYSPVLFDLSVTPKNKTAIELAQEITDMYTTKAVPEWEDYTENLRKDIPNIERCFSGIIGSLMTLVLEDDVVDKWAPELMGIFNMSPEDIEFFMDHYIPELRNATDGLVLDPIEKIHMIGNGLGTIIKLLYAFLWQEDVLGISGEFFLDPKINNIGWYLLPQVNLRASQMTSFRYYDIGFQTGENIYPGDSVLCNPLVPHAKWHLQSAIGILDVTHLVDDMHRIFSGITNTSTFDYPN